MLSRSAVAHWRKALTVPNALEVVREAKAGAGRSRLISRGRYSPRICQAALDAGAGFIVAPTLNLDVIALCRQPTSWSCRARLPQPGSTAWEAGADIVKVFPADVVGPAFFKAMRGPLPHIRLMPTGGVDLTTAAEFLKAGACCLGVGSQLVDPKLVAAREFDKLRDLAAKYVEVVRWAKLTTA